MASSRPWPFDDDEDRPSGSVRPLSQADLAAGSGGRVGHLDSKLALAGGRHRGDWGRWRTAWQPAYASIAPGGVGGRWVGSGDGQLGTAVPAQPRLGGLAARGGRGAAHRPAARAAGAARVGGPARPRCSRELGQPGSPGDRSRRGVRYRLQAVSGPPLGRLVRGAVAATPSPPPCGPSTSRPTEPLRSWPTRTWWCGRSWPSTAPQVPWGKMVTQAYR
jgi:hypothetical protein